MPLRILLVGKGLSAADVISQSKKHRITHLIPPSESYQNDPLSSSRVLDDISVREEEFPEHARAWEYINYPALAPDYYQQKTGWQLVMINKNILSLLKPDGTREEKEFDLTCILMAADQTFPNTVTKCQSPKRESRQCLI